MAKTADERDFREHLKTVDAFGRRVWLFPEMPIGKLYELRKYVSYLLLAIMIGFPFIKINGHPLFLFNVIERKFILFGQIFWPQDFSIVVIGLIAFFIFIILFTVIFGRVWCGWACPQTIFMEMIYRRIEYWIEGTANQQRRLAQAPWSAEKARKRIAKHLLFLFVSFVIAHIVQAWIVGTEQVFKNFTTPPSENVKGFVSMIVITLGIYGIYARFREQMCTTFCPYGRLQGVLLGDDSMVVAYDYERGEPRGKVKDKEQDQLGDCIDCELCVRVCPTGIDIRNGTQLECVNCTACIDACNGIMEKVGREKDLIGYHSIESIESGKKFKLSPRQKAYSVLMVLTIGLLAFLLTVRSDIESTILRAPGTMYYLSENDQVVSNLYKIQLINKTFEEIPFEIAVEDPEFTIEMVGENARKTLPSSEEIEMMFFIRAPRNKFNSMNNKMTIFLNDEDGKRLSKHKVSFLSPVSKSNS